jgi:GntR family transcriptional regulator / MocR family aminotransferase
MTRRPGWADLYAIQVDRTDGTPLFRQIYAQMRSAILQRTLRPGTKLPSTRDLAGRLSVSRNAVVAAYEQLLAEGYASGKIGAGTYIAADFPEPFVGAPPRKKRTPPGRTGAQLPRSLEVLDVTTQDDASPFNLRAHINRWPHCCIVAQAHGALATHFQSSSSRLFQSAGYAAAV